MSFVEYRRRTPVRLAAIMAAALLALQGACAPQQMRAVQSDQAIAAAQATATPLATATPQATAAPQATAVDTALKPLIVEPAKGVAGDPFTVSGDGFPGGKTVEFVWMTWDGSYLTGPSSENVEFYDRQFKEMKVNLGQVTAGADGRVSLKVTAPEDYGQVHDIYAVVDGKDVAHGGYRIERQATIDSTAGPVGAPITIRVTGLGIKPYEMLGAVTYDNKYTGFISGVTTKGTAVVQIRAAGPVGEHVIQLIGSSHAVPYLNVPQSPLADTLSDYTWTYRVTEDNGAPADRVDWPEDRRVASGNQVITKTSSSGVAPAPGVSATIEPGAGPVLSKATVRAGGLPPNTEIGLLWVTSRGNRVSPSGWSLEEKLLTQAITGGDGSLTADVQVPDGLGGWHVIKLVQGEKVLAEVPFRVEASLLGVSPARVREGETFTVHIKGVGWTELDNALAVTYDNGYVGYACGFNSNGDISLELVATGGPGTHLVDLYPMIYQGHGKPLWTYEKPQLSYAQDHPGLALGYRLPAIRVAVEVVP